jgi:hypothetical protein
MYDANLEVAHARARDLSADAARARLATCCRPSAVRRAVTGALARLRRTPDACCA